MIKEYYFFLLPFFYSFAIACILLFTLIRISDKKKFTDKRNAARHIHSNGISRFGGIALISSFIGALLLDRRLVIDMPLAGILFAIVAIMVFGVIDDFKQLNWKTQLIFQLFVVFFVYFFGVKLQYITNPFGGILFFSNGLSYFFGLIISIVWMVFLMNAMNWVDGIDGISGGITFIAAAAIFILSLRPEVNQPPIGIITAALLGGITIFLILNFYPAKIMAGTSGSMFMGFILAVLAIFAGAKIATTLMVLAVPIVDALWVMVERIRCKKSIFIADRRHLHYRLLELGWTSKKICILYYLITVIIAVLALNMRSFGKISTLIISAMILVSAHIIISKRVSDLNESKIKE